MMFHTATPRIASYVIVRKANKIAFVLRANTSWMNDYYGLPSGKVEKNESFSAGAIREALEEIDVMVKLDDLRYVHVMHRHEGTDWVDVYFEVLKWQGTPNNAEPHMHSELAWLDPKNLPNNIIPSLKYALEQIQAGNAYSEYGWQRS